MRRGDSSANGKSSWARFVTALVIAATAVALGLFYFSIAGPDRKFEPFEPFGDYPTEPMQAAMEAGRVSAEHEAILGLGSRFMGQPGWKEAAEVIRSAFERAGLEIYEQEFDTVAPVTAFREIYRVGQMDGGRSERSELLENVEIYPLMPNQLQPVVTPGEGITGELVLLDEETINTRGQFDDCIGLVDGRKEQVDRNYKYEFHRYAALGVKALIVSHPDGLEHAEWSEFGESRARWSMTSSLPVNYVRLAASKEIFNYLGETIRLHIRVNYERVRNTNVIGVLRAAQPAAEALLLTAPYDSPSFLPDRAPGVLMALAPAVQLRLLEGLGSYRESLRRDIIFCAVGSTVMAQDGHDRILRLVRKNEGLRPRRSLEFGSFDPLTDRIVGATMDETDPRQVWLAERWEENERSRWRVAEIRRLFRDERFANGHDATKTAQEALDGRTREFLEAQFAYVVDTLAFEFKEPMVRAKIEVEREGDAGVIESPSFRRFLAAKRRYEEVVAAGGYRFTHFLQQKADLAARVDLRERFIERVDELGVHHLDRRRELIQEAALLNLLTSYERIGVFSTRLAPAPPESGGEVEVINSDTGSRDIQTSANTLLQMVGWAKGRLDLGDSLGLPVADDWGWLGVQRNSNQACNRQAARMWGGNGYPTFFIFNMERKESYRRFSYPVDLPFMRDLSSLESSLAATGEVFLSLAHGNGNLEPTRIVADILGFSYGGRVLAADIGQSIVPDYPVSGALVVCRSRPDSNMWAYPGHYRHPILITDVYGRYSAPFNFNDFPVFPFKSKLQRG